MSMSILACIVAGLQTSPCAIENTNNVQTFKGQNISAANAKQDMIVVKPVAGSPYKRAWQGLYAGGSLGYGYGSTTQMYDRNANHGLATINPSGLSGSITAGYNFRFNDRIVAGIEADFGLMGLSTGTKNIYDGHRWKARFGPAWGSARVRLGYLWNEDWLLFGTTGLAFMHTNSRSIGNTAPETAYDKSFRTGFAIGAGAEYAINQNMTAKLEYLYMDFGKYSGLSANNEEFYFKDSINMIRLGVNYHF